MILLSEGVPWLHQLLASHSAILIIDYTFSWSQLPRMYILIGVHALL